MQQPQGKDFIYRLVFVEFNESSENIRDLLRQKAWKNNAVWDAEMQKREESIYKNYTKLPDTLPERVCELSDTISNDTDNDYDCMVALTQYLKKYPYTTSPKDCPKEEDFTDYFLFEGKSGYCSYFATALAVMGRCEGIPTRYVSGFSTRETCGKKGELTLTQREAHAWTEAYIKHVGWVRFDATPGYSTASSAAWEKEEAKGVGKMDPAVEPIDTAKPSVQSTEQFEPTDRNNQTNFSQYGIVMLKVFLLFAACIVTAIIVLWIRKRLQNRKYAGLEMLAKIQWQMKRLLLLGKLYGVPISDGETLEAYRRRVHKRLDTPEYTMEEACFLYEKIRFGAKTVSPEQLRELEDYVKKAEQSYLADAGLIRKLAYYIL